MGAQETIRPSRRYITAVLVSLSIALPLIGWGLIGALASNSNDPRQWLPSGFDETKKYEWLQEHFGRDEITVVSWSGCELGDERIDLLIDALVKDSEDSFFQRAISGPQVLQQLMAPPLDLSRRTAMRRLQGVLFGSDGRTTCVVLTVSERGEADRVGAIARLRHVATQECGIAPDQLRLGGPTVDAATIDAESQHLLLELSALSGVVAFGITWLRLRSVRLSAMILVVAVYATGASLAILYFTGGHMNLVMTMLPPLVYVLSISAAVHLANYYRDAMAEEAPQDAPWRALANGWRPCTLASGTTAVGLISLAASEIVPVKMFGIYSAVGVCIGLMIVLLLLPVLLTLWPTSFRSGVSVATAPGTRWRGTPLVDRICRYHAVIVISCLVAFTVTGTGLLWLRSTVKLQYRFGADSRIIHDYQWLEEHLGPLVPLELVIHFGGDNRPEFLDQLHYVAILERQLKRLPDVGAALSGADFGPVVSSRGGIFAVSRRAVLRGKVPEIERALRDAHFLADGEEDENLWRISIRAPALSNVDYGRFVDTLRKSVDPAVRKLSNVRVTYTGVIPLIYKAQRELLNDLVESFFLAFVLIACVMVAVLRGLRSGIMAMLPNVFPAVVIFGLMGWLNIWIEIGSIMTASAAMGIAVDDTFHFLTWFRHGSRQGMSRHESLDFAYRRCAGAMMHTTIICSAGLLIFTLSSFMPIVRFSWMMTALLITALIGDLVFLPALLAGPLGKLFVPKKDEGKTSVRHSLEA